MNDLEVAVSSGKISISISLSKREEQAVAPLVAVMLLIAIVVVASVAFYGYSVGLLGSVQKPAQHGSEILVIEDIVYTANGSVYSANITVRNIGSIDSKIGAIYVDSATKYGPNGAAPIRVGQALTFTLPNVTPTQHNLKWRH